MASVFRMLYRILILFPVLIDLVGRAEYETMSQKALKQWSDAQPAGSKLIAVEGKYPDKVRHLIQDTNLKERIQVFISATKSTIYLLRLVDGQSPVIGKFYYCCALVDKHLRVLKETNKVPYIDQMRTIFMKRWRRWHRPIHTMAYALDPCYQSHQLTREEVQDCLKVTVQPAVNSRHSLAVIAAVHPRTGDEEDGTCELAQTEDQVRLMEDRWESHFSQGGVGGC